MGTEVDKIFECKIKISVEDRQALQIVTEKMTIVMVRAITEGSMTGVHCLHKDTVMTTGTLAAISGATIGVITGATTEIGMARVAIDVVQVTNLPGIDAE